MNNKERINVLLSSSYWKPIGLDMLMQLAILFLSAYGGVYVYKGSMAGYILLFFAAIMIAFRDWKTQELYKDHIGFMGWLD